MMKLALITVALLATVAEASPVYLYCWSDIVQDFIYTGKYDTWTEAEVAVGDYSAQGKHCRIQEELE